MSLKMISGMRSGVIRGSIHGLLVMGLVCVAGVAMAQTPVPPVAPAPPAPAPLPALQATFSPPVAPGPFAIRSADGASRLRVGGLIQSDLYAFPGNAGRTGNGGFLLRRARPLLDGTFNNFIDFRLLTEFGQGNVGLQDAYMDLHLRPSVILRSGKFKVPYSLERLQFAADVPFVERSIADNLIPIRDVGVMLAKGPEGNGLEWQIGAFNGVGDNANGDSNNDNNFDVAARVFYQPFRGVPRHGIQGLGFGVAGIFGSPKDSTANTVYRTAARSVFFRYADGVSLDGKRQRIQPQFFLYRGSLGILGAYHATRQRVRKGTVAETVATSGINLQATYVLTGEKTSFRNVVPKHDYNPATGRGGAYEVTLRYSQVKTDDALFDRGFVNRANAAEKTDAYTVGMNAYLTRQFKALLTYEHTNFDHALTFSTGNRKHEDVIQTQFQLQF